MTRAATAARVRGRLGRADLTSARAPTSARRSRPRSASGSEVVAVAIRRRPPRPSGLRKRRGRPSVRARCRPQRSRSRWTSSSTSSSSAACSSSSSGTSAREPALAVSCAFDPPRARARRHARGLRAAALPQRELLAPGRAIRTLLDTSAACFARARADPRPRHRHLARPRPGERRTARIVHDLSIYRDLAYVTEGAAMPDAQPVPQLQLPGRDRRDRARRRSARRPCRSPSSTSSSTARAPTRRPSRESSPAGCGSATSS